MTRPDFICMGSAKLFGPERERKSQNENIDVQRDSNPRHATPRQVNQRFRPLGHGALMMICGLQDSGIQINKLKPFCDNTCQIDYGYKCIWTDCQTKSTFLISMSILTGIITLQNFALSVKP